MFKISKLFSQNFFFVERILFVSIVIIVFVFVFVLRLIFRIPIIPSSINFGQELFLSKVKLDSSFAE
jgi:hypothetical protein